MELIYHQGQVLLPVLLFELLEELWALDVLLPISITLDQLG